MAANYYDYTDAREYSEAHGLVFAEHWLPEADKAFQKLKLTQKQVNGLMREYIWRIHWLFSPKNYTFKQRFLLAMHFLLKMKL